MSDDALLIDALLRAMRELRWNYDIHARATGLTMSRARLVSTLAKMEGATQAEVAAAMGVVAPTLKRQLDALERDGFIERRGLEGDARKRALYLTEKARASRISHYVDSVRAEVLEGIDADDQKRTCAVLERIADNAARLNRS